MDGLTAAGATDFKGTHFRAAVARFFAGITINPDRSSTGKAAVSTRRRMVSQIRAFIKYAQTTEAIVADQLAGYSPVGSREQDDTNREVLTVAQARALVGLNRPADSISQTGAVGDGVNSSSTAGNKGDSGAVAIYY